MLGVWDLKGTHRYKHSLNPCAVCKRKDHLENVNVAMLEKFL